MRSYFHHPYIFLKIRFLENFHVECVGKWAKLLWSINLPKIWPCRDNCIEYIYKLNIFKYFSIFPDELSFPGIEEKSCDN